MPTKRNNNPKDFAIGTKIEYNGKLYKVVESINCGDCSLKNICSNNDVDKPNSDACILRDKRICIFGECSSSARSDGKSVVFVEFSTAKEPDVYNVAPLYKTNNELTSIRINVPNNYVIDKENSDLDKGIIKFKSKWLTLEQLYKLAKDNVYFTNRDAIKDFANSKMVALANLIDIARYFNGDWKYRIRGNNCGYMIAYDKTRTEEDNYQVVHINSDTDMYFGNIMFKNEADAQYVIDNPNFKNILDIIFKL